MSSELKNAVKKVLERYKAEIAKLKQERDQLHQERDQLLEQQKKDKNEIERLGKKVKEVTERLYVVSDKAEHAQEGIRRLASNPNSRYHMHHN